MNSDRQWLGVGGVLIAIALLVALGWTVRDRFMPVDVGSRAPDFAAVDLGGREVSLDDARGDVVMLNIWATWCPPCREEMPSMQRLYEEVGDEGLRIIAVSVDAAPGRVDPSGRAGGDVAEFARDMGLTFEIWHDPSGRIQQTYRTTGVPESFVINRDGIIVKKVIGSTMWDSEANVALVRRLLAE